MSNKPLFNFDTDKLEAIAVALRETEFSFKGIEKETEQTLTESLTKQFESEGTFGAAFGFDPWPKLADSTLAEKKRLGFGNKQILERTGKLKQAVTNPSVSVVDNGFTIEAKFSGEHAFLIPIHQRRRPLVILTEPDFDKLGQVALDQVIKSFGKRLKNTKVRSSRK